jgi:hypothetical protein
MKRCPSCNRTYTDVSLNFCLEDGTPLISGDVAAPDPNATIRYTDPRRTNPPPTEIYQPQPPLLNQVDSMSRPQQWAPLPPQPRKKSNAVWWILGGVVVVGIIGVGLIIMILAVASISSNSNSNVANTNSKTSNRNSNANSNAANVSNTNSNANLPVALTDDFSETKWGTGNFAFGDIWYKDDEYHLRSKDGAYLVMYAPTSDYNTADAIVSVTARNVDGQSVPSGYGLIVHGEKTKSGQLEDYALLINTEPEPQYKVIEHKGGTELTMVPWTKSSVIRSGTTPNRLEVRVKGTQLSFYINDQYVDRITDSDNFRRGKTGFYTSDATEVAFDDLEIRR